MNTYIKSAKRNSTYLKQLELYELQKIKEYIHLAKEDKKALINYPSLAENLVYCSTTKIIPEDLILQLLDLGFKFYPSLYQPLSKEFIINNLDKLNLNELLHNLNLPADMENYIRMFI